MREMNLEHEGTLVVQQRLMEDKGQRKIKRKKEGDQRQFRKVREKKGKKIYTTNLKVN